MDLLEERGDVIHQFGGVQAEELFVSPGRPGRNAMPAVGPLAVDADDARGGFRHLFQPLVLLEALPQALGLRLAAFGRFGDFQDDVSHLPVVALETEVGQAAKSPPLLVQVVGFHLDTCGPVTQRLLPFLMERLDILWRQQVLDIPSGQFGFGKAGDGTESRVRPDERAIPGEEGNPRGHPHQGVLKPFGALHGLCYFVRYSGRHAVGPHCSAESVPQAASGLLVSFAGALDSA
nr:hypothetical protein [Pseudomonas indica]